MTKAFPVKHGDAREAGGLSGALQKLILDCQQGLQSLLKQDDDLKLKLAAIKLVFDYGWGRPRVMDAAAAPDQTTVMLDGKLEEIFQKLMERHADDDERDDGHDEGERLLDDANAGTMGPDSPPQSAST